MRKRVGELGPKTTEERARAVRLALDGWGFASLVVAGYTGLVRRS